MLKLKKRKLKKKSKNENFKILKHSLEESIIKRKKIQARFSQILFELLLFLQQ